MTKIDEITESIYEAYGSGTGVLFGIPSELRSSVRAIVKLVLEQAQKSNTPNKAVGEEIK